MYVNNGLSQISWQILHCAKQFRNDSHAIRMEQQNERDRLTKKSQVRSEIETKEEYRSENRKKTVKLVLCHGAGSEFLVDYFYNICGSSYAWNEYTEGNIKRRNRRNKMLPRSATAPSWSCPTVPLTPTAGN